MASEIEIRHDERNLLIELMQIDDMDELKMFIAKHKGKMEPEDVKLAEAQVREIKARRKK